MLKKNIAGILLLIFIIGNMMAQRPSGLNNFSMSQEGIISGRIMDSLTGLPIEYATISIYRFKDTTLITGTITDSLGRFRIEGLTFGYYFAEVSFIGFTPYRTTLFMLTPKQKTKDLGIIRLMPSAAVTEEIEITAERPRIEFKLDKKIIHVSHDLSSAGGTAVNVLENTPSVETDIEGNVSLRGSTNFKVLIDGKPSVLKGAEALRQIPASTIETIEIITNPSAKYDPDGLAGLINVVLKKNKAGGINGMISASASSNYSYNSTYLVNYRSGKTNLFTGASINTMNHNVLRDVTREIYSADTSFESAHGKGNMLHKNYSFKAGMDWFLTDKTTVSVSGEAGESQAGRIASMNYRKYSTNQTIRYYVRESRRIEQGPEWSSTLTVDHKFSGDQNKLQGLFFFSARPEAEQNTNDEYVSDADWNKLMRSDYQQRSFSSNNDRNWRAQLDYTRIYTEDSKLEAGLISESDRDQGDYQFETYLAASDTWVTDPLQTNQINFRRNIHGGYTVYSDKLAGIGFQAGFRSELTDMLLQQITTTQSFRTYKLDFFPTLHLSKQLPLEQQIMTSYSRRINRPDEHDLNPFPFYMSREIFRVGNPELQAEYINSFELGYQKRIGMSQVSLETYYRETKNKIERVSRLLNDSTTYYTYSNLSGDFATGVELTANVNLARWWNVFTTGTFYNYQIKGTLDSEGDINQTTQTWNLRFVNNFRLLKRNTRIQITGFYSAPTVTAQGTRGEFLTTGIGLRHDFHKGRYSATFNIQDLFSSMKINIAMRSAGIYNHFILTHEAPVFNLSLTCRINNYKEEKNENGTARKYLEGGGEF